MTMETTKPYSLFINILPQMWSTIRNAWPILLLIVAGAEALEHKSSTWSLSASFSPFPSPNGNPLFTLRYRISPEKGLQRSNGPVGSACKNGRSKRFRDIEMVQNPSETAGLVEPE